MELLALLLLLLGGTRKRGETPAGSPGLVPALPGKGGGTRFSTAWRERTSALMKRAIGGAKWAPRFAKLLGSPAAGAAAARWIGIESGGNPRANSALNERGLAQVMEKSYKELGLSDAEWRAMADPSTSDDEHARIAAKVIAGEVARAGKVGAMPDPGWGPPVAPSWGKLQSTSGVGAGKLRHGLPLLMRELQDGGFLRPSLAGTLRAALTGFKPSDRLASFAKGAHAVTGNVAADLLLRFLASAAVVALAEDAITIGDIGDSNV